MLIPHSLLDPEIFQRMLEDFVTRDGTDNGYEDTLEQRVTRLRKLIERGEVVIVYHADTGDTSLTPRRDVPPEMFEQ